MTFDIAIVNASMVVPNVGIVNTNIAIKDGKIVEFTPDYVQADKKIDAEGLHVLPGAIDPHVHYGVYTSIDKAAETESRSAAIGGVTTMMRMFRLYDSYREKLKAHLDASERSHIVDYAYHASILVPEHVSEIDYCIDAGITSFKLYLNLKGELGTIYMDMEPYTNRMISGNVNTDDILAQSTIKTAASSNALVLTHAEDPSICSNEMQKARKEGKDGLETWSECRPSKSEHDTIIRISEWARESKCKLYLPHIGSAAAIEAIKKERENGTELYVETCPHYLTHTTDFQNITAKVVPPIRSKEDVQRMWEAIVDGTIDCIGTDHVANRLNMKLGDGDLWSALAGFPGIATMVPVLLSEGVNKGRLGIEKVAAITSLTTAKIFGMFPKKGTIAIGSDADIVLVDLEKEQKVTPELLQSYSEYTIYDGMKFKGWPITTIVRGELVMEDGEVIGKPGHGKFIARSTKSG
ncbi:MAG: dihydroorotase family protein [Nitrososphaerales archaeon]